MTPKEVIDHAEMVLETIEAKNEAEGGCVGCDEKAKDFYRSAIECAKKAMIVDQARTLASQIRTDDIPWVVKEGKDGKDDNDN